ncbi:MAG TPA: citrate (Si)-synthase, eukaryotic [Chitinophagaceae bacterium]|nr:citrate (Si)-synthase, eukaryotic [Chitinophagaceae bacterium]
MKDIKEKFKQKSEELGKEIKEILANHGEKEISSVKIRQLYQGMRGMPGLVSETSLLDPINGIRFRGFSIPELKEKLPTAEEGDEPLPEGLFYLMLIGELPSDKEVEEISNAMGRRSQIPKHVFNTIDELPIETHPMTQFVTGIMAMQTESVFAKAYKKGINKKDYWEYTFEDVTNLISRLPRLAAYIYRRKYRKGEHIEPNPELDWAGNFAHMLGFDNKEFRELMRLYLTIHADHEGGNASAHTTHLVGSTLSDPYLSFAGGMNSLAGPLHGLANQEVIRWIEQMRKEIGDGLPTKEQIENYVKQTLDAGKVVPGYGHAVLRQTDPRFTAQMNFAKEHLPDDDLVNVVWRIYDVVPDILKDLGKVKNPWPNVDAHSGALLVHYGLEEYEFYTVLFGVARSLGVLASLCWDRALGLPLERPKSLTTKRIKEIINGEEEV